MESGNYKGCSTKTKNIKKNMKRAMKKKSVKEKKWSEKYKKSIDCNNPKGFSQKAHCAGRKKRK